MSDYLKIVENGETPNINRNVWVPSSDFDWWKSIKRGHQSNYYMCKLTRAIYDIAIKPGPRSFSNKKTLTLNGAQIHYSILECGDVVVDKVISDDSISTPEENQDTGLYYVYYDQISDSFKTSNSSQDQLPYNHHWDGIHYVAVSGKFTDKEEAGWELIKHIRKAYDSSVYRYLRNQLSDESHYALFWQNDQYYDSKNAQSLAAWIAHGQGHCMPINWLVHGEGTDTFAQALKLLIKQPGIHPFKGDNGNENGKIANQNTMGNQQVFFSNPRGPNGGRGITEKKLRNLCEQAGMHMSGTNINPLDVFHNRDARMEGLTTAATIAAGTAATGITSEAGFTKVKSAFEMTQDFATAAYTGDASHLSPRSVAGVTAFCITAFACVKKLSAYIRNTQGALHPTKGNGDNKSWAEKKS
ncbi:hypothetical protein ACJJIF_14775 [Microbulbifer sp. SSSA002]|uniref:hypothetical protein n=1 Tax=Microbulbifer sp. SSSA002 TaxID=3243376 RepID=UPI00403A7AEC